MSLACTGMSLYPVLEKLDENWTSDLMIGDPTEMMVTWVTFSPTVNQTVEYNVHGEPLRFNATGTMTKFKDGGWLLRVLYIHRTKLTGLKPEQSYDYRCGGGDYWSEVYTFKTPRSGEDWSPRIALYGDLGTDGQSLSLLTSEALNGNFDVILHVEFYFFYHKYGSEQIANQYKWLEADLKEATRKRNRAKRPWIITMGHRPMYCSNAGGDDCTQNESKVRTGLNSKYGLEDLFYMYGVDLMVWAHEHSYERLYPVYNRKLCRGPVEKAYINPCAPVHIITGSAGCKEHHDAFKPKYGPWTAFRALDYGYTRMKIHNNTHLYMEQVSADKGGEIIDHVWIVKHRHGPGAWIMPMK
ncbi:Iron/zinc purple acid phosphatase-like protein [Stylophora pistillata]|uniref:Purple acid phosphatase n=1 Tax=Stylophora pistillata TaxID=50429 RepID=A0A2B4SBD6_STYPI|nr:Iron/zinc purple acid phosphatase-like protein [Stylophora pistillata]